MKLKYRVVLHPGIGSRDVQIKKIKQKLKQKNK